MGKNKKKTTELRMLDAFKVGYALSITDFTKAAAKESGLSRKEINAIAFGASYGVAAGCGIATGDIECKDPEKLAVLIATNAVEHYDPSEERQETLVIDVRD